MLLARSSLAPSRENSRLFLFIFAVNRLRWPIPSAVFKTVFVGRLLLKVGAEVFEVLWQPQDFMACPD